MNVEVLVPWRGGDPHRERALAWVRERLGWSVTVSQAPDGPWSKGAALWPAAVASTAELLVIHDADCHSDGIPGALDAVEAGEPWAMPHTMVYRLSETATTDLIETGTSRRDTVRSTYEGWWGGGIVVLPRETFLSVPMDPRFRGWGGEDLSWANALWFLAGRGWRGKADLLHLWHPPEPTSLSNRLNPDAGALARRYRHARSDPNEMRLLVNEAIEELEGHVADDAPEQALHAGAPH